MIHTPLDCASMEGHISSLFRHFFSVTDVFSAVLCCCCICLLSKSPLFSSWSALEYNSSTTDFGGGWYSRAKSRMRRSLSSCFPKIFSKSLSPSPNRSDEGLRLRTDLNVEPEGENAFVGVISKELHQSGIIR